MTEQNNDRPFAVGDLVVCKIGEDKKIGIIKKYSPYFVSAPCFVGFEKYDLWVKRHEVITIRKPRKGGKEARDIVAMLGRMYKKDLSGILKTWNYFSNDSEKKRVVEDYWIKRKSGVFAQNNPAYLCFVKAKSML